MSGARFDGERFHNEEPLDDRGRGVWKWMLTRRRGPWRPYEESPPGPPPPERVSAGEMRVTFLGHASVLLQMDGLNVLTDPSWSERASPFSFLGPRRHRPPGIRWEDLPPIDLVLLSHDHYDHLDVPTLKRLAREHRPRFLVGLRNGPLLEKHGIGRVTEMDWGDSVEVGEGVRVTAAPARHWSGRGLRDRGATLWLAFVLQGPAGTVYHAGDTGYGGHFQRARERFGPVRLAVLPIGAFRPRWFMKEVHMDPEEAVTAHEELGAGTSVAIHFGTFRLADDAQDEPVEELRRAVAARAEEPRFWVLREGEGREVPPAG